FYIPETKETVQARIRPIVIITSNAEKELPDAFLRRCIFHYIAFPEPEKMEEIVRVHFDDVNQELLNQAMDTFYRIRQMKNIQKLPSTSELLDWLQALALAGIDVQKIGEEIPFVGVLLKKNQDIEVMYEIKEKGYSLRNW
ncbi:MAG: MoxR family ATPase, partial [Clostridia bacterium]|nr:MoxR family ATPase [Clostridia bacterium]